MSVSKAYASNLRPNDTIKTNQNNILMENYEQSEVNSLISKKSKDGTLSVKNLDKKETPTKGILITQDQINEVENKEQVDSSNISNLQDQNYPIYIAKSDIRQSIDSSGLVYKDNIGIKNCSRIFADKKSSLKKETDQLYIGKLNRLPAISDSKRGIYFCSKIKIYRIVQEGSQR